MLPVPVRLMDTNYTQLCRVRQEMLEVMDHMRRASTGGDITEEDVGRFRARCTTIMGHQEKVLASLERVDGSPLRGIGGDPRMALRSEGEVSMKKV